MSMRRNLPRMASITSTVNSMVSRNASRKLVGCMARPNMIWSTSAVTTTKPSIHTPSTRPTAQPMAAKRNISRKM